ncbi:MAG: hypothetical protein ACRDWI_00370 [Jiangellaceae bacterium]
MTTLPGPGPELPLGAYGRRVGDDALARLEEFLSEYTDEIHALACEVLRRVDERLPGATRMVYVNWNATVVGYSPDGESEHAVCSVATYPRWVNLFFLVGPDLPDPQHLLQGTGSTVRRVRITGPADFDHRVDDLLDAAIAMWAWPFDPDRPGTTTIVAVSDKQRPRR